MSKLATILMASVQDGIGARAQRWLLEEYNCSLGNNCDALKADPEYPLMFPDAKHVIPIFGYKESYGQMWETWLKWAQFGDPKNLYYYNCGDGDWNGLDEPGTRGTAALRPFNFGRAYQENEMVHALMPGLKTVVTHPFPQSFTDARIPSDVWGWGLPYIMQYGINWREGWNIPADKEVWCYLTDADLNSSMFDLATVGEICRKYGIAACLVYKATHPRLWDVDTKVITKDGRRFLEGMVNA